MSRSFFQKEIKTILIDDEEIALHRLKKVLEAYPMIKVIGEATDGRSAIALINQLQPDLVFLDIQMPELTGFEVLSGLEVNPMIVFVTAYEEYAVKAFEENSLDYLLKPVEEERLAITVNRILKKSSSGEDTVSAIRKLLLEVQEKKNISTIPVKTGQKISLIHVPDIYYFEARDKYVFIHTKDSEYLVDYPLNFLEEHLPEVFMRVNRGYIVNKMQIKEIHKYFKGTYVFIMNDLKEMRIKTSNSYSLTIKKQLLTP